MASVKSHYEQVLADSYSWMLGGMDSGLAKNRKLFEALGINAVASGSAVDLGAGCGFQSIPLAELGYAVTAIDTDATLLQEMQQHAGNLNITAVEDDLVNFANHLNGKADLLVCMTDTLLHLESEQRVEMLFQQVAQHLKDGGRFIASFRDLTVELEDLARFIPVKSDDNRIFTCFLEYEQDRVKVHDIVHQRVDGQWQLRKSFYRKLRLSADRAEVLLQEAGFSRIEHQNNNGMLTFVAFK